MAWLTAAWRRFGLFLASHRWFQRFVGPKVLTKLDRALISRTGRSLTSPASASNALPMLNLTATGASSGLPRTVPLAYYEDEGDFLVVASNWGREHHPAWSTNLLAHPDAEVVTSSWSGSVRAERLEGDDLASHWPILVRHLPNWEDYRRMVTGRDIRVFRLRRLG